MKHRTNTLVQETQREQDVLVAEAFGGYLDYQEAQNQRTREAIHTVDVHPHRLISEESFC